MFGWIWLIAASFLMGLGAELLTHRHPLAGVVALSSALLLAVDLAAGWWYERRHPKPEDGGER